MKSLKIKSIFIISFILALVLAGTTCEGPEGPTGPQGPQGTEGSQGEQGPEGPQGDEGTANVMYSGWIKVTFTPTPPPVKYEGHITAPRLTQDLIDKGEIVVYMKNSINQIFKLSSFGQEGYYSFRAQLGKITIVSGSSVAPSNDYRYVLIPGGVFIPGGIITSQANINFDDYAEVARTFNIPD